MRLTCQQEDLHRGLSAVARAIPARSTLPITQHVLVEADEGKITLSATDAETIAITYTIPATIEEAGSITMPSRLLSDFVATLPHDPITLSLAERSRQVKLSCARNEASIGGMDAEDFPPIPPVDGADTIPLEASRLRSAISQTVFAAATDDWSRFNDVEQADGLCAVKAVISQLFISDALIKPLAANVDSACIQINTK